MLAKDTTPFFQILTESLNEQRFIKLTLSDRRDKTSEVKNVSVKPVMLKGALMLQVVYRYPTKDITQNYLPAEALEKFSEMMDKDFLKADLFTTANDFHLTIIPGGKAVLSRKPATATVPAGMQHDKAKRRYVDPENNVYLQALGITTTAGKVKSDKQDKFRQINKYVEIVEDIIEEAGLLKAFSIADMGSGKGYLTFALYDYLTNQLKLQPEVTGIEMRQELVDTCNRIAAEAGFSKLNFRAGSIDSAELPKVNMLIALHACDTATDQAIYRGIRAEADVIICAPCCHKQIRKQIHPTNALDAITRFGILEERQAEIVTDTIRALVLEAFGYKTKVFEFISTEHTPKNLLITGIKINQAKGIKPEALDKIKKLKALFDVEQHHLEKLMAI
jgi:hypothetical protein